MGANAPSFSIVNPSFIEPGIIMPYFQASGAFSLLGGGGPLNKLSEGDLWVYMKALDIRTKIAAGQTAYNKLPSVAIVPRMISTPSYLLRVRGEWDHHDAAAWSRWGVGIKDMQTLGMRQAHFQLARTALLSGFNPVNGEGLLYATGATSINLPADSSGNTTISTYDNGQLATFFLSIISAMKARMNQAGIPHRVVVIGPQQDLLKLEYQNIVQLTSYQRPGGGVESTKGMFQAVLGDNGDTLEWGYDDTLIGKGAGGTDAIIFGMPEVVKPTVGGSINTNIFAELEPGILATTTMYCDMAAPREIPTPLPGGAIDVLSEWRITSGWPIRPEGVSILSAAP
jgi:hypothetical protein